MRKKITRTLRLSLSLAAMIALLYFILGVPSSKAQIQQYHTPLRSWIKVGTVEYTTAQLSAAQIDFAASNFDIFDGPDATNLDDIKAKTDAISMAYDNIYCIYVGRSKYNSMSTWASSHGLTSAEFENMFIHYSNATSVTFSDGTYTIDPSRGLADSRVPTYGWYGTAGYTSRTGARVIMNVGNANYRQFNAEYMLGLTTAQYGGYSYDGVYVDNTVSNIFDVRGTVNSGGTIPEYPGGASVYNADIVKAFQSLRNSFGPRGEAGSKKIYPNIVYELRSDLLPYVDGVFREKFINPEAMTKYNLTNLKSRVDNTEAAGVQSLNTATNFYSGTTLNGRNAISALASYYLTSTANTFFVHQQSNVLSQTDNWIPAVDYNIGPPKDNFHTFAKGIDPASPKKDSGTGTIAATGDYRDIKDTTKSWTTSYWAPTQCAGCVVLDGANKQFSINNSGTNYIRLYNAAWSDTNSPVAGHYEVGNYAYEIYAREFQNALVLYKPFPVTPTSDIKATLESSASATTHTLPQTVDNPSGRYYKLSADGTLSTTPITEISLRDQEGAILVKESAVSQPHVSLTTAVNPTGIVMRGDTLTYTIDYHSDGTQDARNVKIENPIPVGTVYVAGSSKLNNVSKTDQSDGDEFYFDGVKGIWSINLIQQGVSGSVEFKVKIP